MSRVQPTVFGVTQRRPLSKSIQPSEMIAADEPHFIEHMQAISDETHFAPGLIGLVNRHLGDAVAPR